MELTGKFYEGFLALRALGDGREAGVIPLTFGRARIVLRQAGAGWYDDGW